ncbi:MAG TPA: IS110 family transposase [Solirubrobacteraceae bacterium]|nr:IS110 family transposase [Solirubrobacteraceae bacterium]
MIVIGADTHKRSHTVVAVDGVSGVVRGQLTLAATDDGMLDALRFAAGLDEERVWAIEDCRHVSARLERMLVAAGERVIRVAPALTGPTRQSARTPGKSDPVDATAVARAAVREGLESFPAAYLDEAAMEIRVLCDYRNQLIVERTRQINRLRWLLVAIAPSWEAELKRGLKSQRVRDRLARQLARLAPGAQRRVAKTILARINHITQEDHDLLDELTALVCAHSPQLLAQRGVGTVTAAIIIGHTAGAQRFRSDAAFARHAGVAPIPASSGNTTRYRLHRGGDRQLNRALHIIAIANSSTDPATRAYLDRKTAEGKTRLEAIRCLKRHLARRIYHLLTPHPDTQNPLPPKSANTELLLT